MDWANYSLADIVKDVKAFLAKSSLNIPVIAAGGIFTGGEAAEMMSDTGCDGIQAATRLPLRRRAACPMPSSKPISMRSLKTSSSTTFHPLATRCACFVSLRP